ncbi:hypothetical protein EIN_403620 [Entamoeba invadens IP1]|uniref:HMG box domain-containing protein n=1 Tax=Entamoeba invadens IP1 TaxID=370355 RepID=A0A0A1U6I2_ENTIV|nr:hypothetical protein EIN_403620 [Entamoeba invadens IP1]ELP90028.1 hypothetical protein EIN_403620 [Entamoeba invadens IP1]|eukprot:XP_004256799.1 hypothetical protein EIN_403620 [Entamoeba invadens IP1]
MDTAKLPKYPTEQPEHHKRKKATNKEKSERREGELNDLAKAIYMKWKGREYLREAPTLTMKQAEERASAVWDTEPEDITQRYYKTAIIENVLLGEDGYLFKKKKNDGMKRKEEWHPYLLFCKQHREELKQEGVSGNEVMAMLSDKWKSLTEEERGNYAEQARINKQRDLKIDDKKQVQLHDGTIPPPPVHENDTTADTEQTAEK